MEKYVQKFITTKAWSDMIKVAMKKLREKMSEEDKKKLKENYLKVYSELLKDDFKSIVLTLDRGY